MRHYDHHHDTVSEARTCEANRQVGTVITRPEGVVRLERAHANNTRVAKATATAAPAFAARPAHPARMQYAKDLINKRDTAMLSFAASEVMMNVLDGKTVSADEVALLIDDLRALPRLTEERVAKRAEVFAAAGMATTQATIPQQTTTARKALWAEWRALAAALVKTSTHPSGARFAIENLAGANDLSFWWISEHNGFCKLRQVIGGGRREEVRDPQRMIDIAKRIQEAGPYEAMIRYGQEIGACGHCGRDLTNEESRAAGIGPICRNK